MRRAAAWGAVGVLLAACVESSSAVTERVYERCMSEVQDPSQDYADYCADRAYEAAHPDT
jgi:hypothetical protein